MCSDADCMLAPAINGRPSQVCTKWCRTECVAAKDPQHNESACVDSYLGPLSVRTISKFNPRDFTGSAQSAIFRAAMSISVKLSPLSSKKSEVTWSCKADHCALPYRLLTQQTCAVLYANVYPLRTIRVAGTAARVLLDSGIVFDTGQQKTAT